METNQDKGSSLLCAPLVVRLKILSYLTLKEQLHLRQVCQATRQWIDSSSLSRHAPATVIVDHGPKTFTKFLEKRPPHVVESLHIKNNTESFLDDPALSYFMRIYSSTITTLRVQQYIPSTSPRFIAFYEGFRNLKRLNLGKISIPRDSEALTVLPNNFKKLEILKIGSVEAYPDPPAEDLFNATLIPLRLQRSMALYTWSLIRHCENIEFLGYPKTSKYFFQAFIDGRGRGEFGVLCDYVMERHQNPNCSQLKICDLQNDNCDPDTKNALPILKLGTEFGVKFLNLNANIFQHIKINSLIKMYDLPSNAGDCILSFRNFNCLITKVLPSVKRVSMSASKVNTMLDYSCLFNGPKTLPCLEEIELVIDVGFSLPEEYIYRRAKEFRGVHTLLSHFFYDMEMILADEPEHVLKYIRVYDSVHSLTIIFTDLPSISTTKANPEDLPLNWIVKAVPNLRKLTLVGWNAQQRETYNLLWNSFPNLEELILDDCDFLAGSCSDKRANESIGDLATLQNLVSVTVKMKENMWAEYEVKSAFERINFYLSGFLNMVDKNENKTRRTFIRNLPGKTENGFICSGSIE